MAVCDLDRERAEALASGTGARTYAGLARTAGPGGPRGVSRRTCRRRPTGRPAVAALGRGLPVYLEKPIARTAEDAAEIVAVAEQHRHRLRGRLPVARARPARRRCLRCWRASRSGCWLGTSIGPTQSRPWFVDMRAGGGNLLERGSHHLDLARTVAGEVASVQTAAGRIRLARSGGEGGDIDDALTMMLEMTSGALATIVVGWTKPGQPGRYGLDIVASDATLRLALDPDFTLTGLSAGQPVDKRAASQPMERSMSRFLRAVRERDPAAVVCTPPDAAATLAVAIAAERALETSRAVPVEALSPRLGLDRGDGDEPAVNLALSVAGPHQHSRISRRSSGPNNAGDQATRGLTRRIRTGKAIIRPRRLATRGRSAPTVSQVGPPVRSASRLAVIVGRTLATALFVNGQNRRAGLPGWSSRTGSGSHPLTGHG